MNGRSQSISVRTTRHEDVDGIIALTREVYPDSPPWSVAQLASHLRLFPEGQFVAVDPETEEIVGMAASLVVRWDDYAVDGSWQDFTDSGMFTSHDPERGRTLYGAEVMVRPSMQGRGVGKRLYAARRGLVERLGLLRIRAGARLVGFHRYADRLTAAEYVARVARGEIGDPTLSFQLRNGFRVLAVVRGYLQHDPKSLGFAAVIEWENPAVAAATQVLAARTAFSEPGPRPAVAATPYLTGAADHRDVAGAA